MLQRLRRLIIRLLSLFAAPRHAADSGADAHAGPPPGDGPPAHWLELVRRRAPGFYRRLQEQGVAPARTMPAVPGNGDAAVPARPLPASSAGGRQAVAAAAPPAAGAAPRSRPPLASVPGERALRPAAAAGAAAAGQRIRALPAALPEHGLRPYGASAAQDEGRAHRGPAADRADEGRRASAIQAASTQRLPHPPRHGAGEACADGARPSGEAGMAAPAPSAPLGAPGARLVAPAEPSASPARGYPESVRRAETRRLPLVPGTRQGDLHDDEGDRDQGAPPLLAARPFPALPDELPPRRLVALARSADEGRLPGPERPVRGREAAPSPRARAWPPLEGMMGPPRTPMAPFAGAAPPWPELPEADDPWADESAAPETGEHLQRIAAEQRGMAWNA